ncbi:methionyl-tRNA formyltransferase [Tessaracoccus sp. MC1865]|uniref:methionyl-tRNA formyltransferase n=1 Tax=Tessaracoccus sp. MC1865 TaxID=2760310 RepID=UPI0015FFEE50|nr:methionyl-tRNA formyltransferase [Tessaracoccus sp. MC1865]MBB1484695.1 methionyl-tRNA formyltransferase [Tessaracoccus sp. MC1865]QTO36360.1 methionyl-tRNA formyltransferase [Tessaracoccus sp. MC1865]
MRLVFAGTPEVAVPSLDALVASQHEVVAVVTRPDAPAGRGRRLTPSPVAVRAEELGIEVLKPAHPRDADFQARLRELAVDVCPVVAYGALLPQSALDIPAHGWVNLHFSLLPRWRGAAPVQRAIMAGDEEIGTACFQIVRELDAGDVYLMESRPMPDATAGELLAALAESGADQLVRAMDMVAAGERPTPQPAEGLTVAAKITVEESRLDWARPAQELRNLIMGCSPDPGAWCELDGQRFKIYRASVADDHALAPGELDATKRQVFVGTGEGTLELLEVQAPGKRRMPAIDWARSGVAGKALT